MSLLETGGYGRVYDVGGGKVAKTPLTDSLAALIAHEAKMLELVRDVPGVVQGCELHAGALYMDHGGTDVLKLLPLPEAVASSVVRQVCAAVAHVHARGVAHRDLKAENVVVDASGVARLVDFGLAVALTPRQRDRLDKGLTDVAGSLGTLAPETIPEPRDYNGVEADLWSLGMFAVAVGWCMQPWKVAHPRDGMYARYCAGDDAPSARMRALWPVLASYSSDWLDAVLDATLWCAPSRRAYPVL